MCRFDTKSISHHLGNFLVCSRIRHSLYLQLIFSMIYKYWLKNFSIFLWPDLIASMNVVKYWSGCRRRLESDGCFVTMSGLAPCCTSNFTFCNFQLQYIIHRNNGHDLNQVLDIKSCRSFIEPLIIQSRNTRLESVKRYTEFSLRTAFRSRYVYFFCISLFQKKFLSRA